MEGCRRMMDEWRTTSSEALAAIEAGQGPRDRPLPYPFEGVYDAAGWHAAHRKVEDEIHFLLAIGLGNLALSYASMSKLGSAEKAMWQARERSDVHANRGANAFSALRFSLRVIARPTLSAL